jgi:hypothetical protein
VACRASASVVTSLAPGSELMSRSCSEFLETFVLPMLGGGDVHVGKPFRARDRETVTEQAEVLSSPELAFLRLRRAQELVPNPELPDPGLDDLSLWMGLHNTLLFDHPERGRVWARSSTWRRAEGVARTLLALSPPVDLAEALARHVSLSSFMRLRRLDVIVPTAVGEVRYLGQDVPRRRLRLAIDAPGGQREEEVVWLDGFHTPESERLVEDGLRASPMTCLLEPLNAPPGWSPLLARGVLQDRGLARAVCHRWASHRDWIAVGGAVMAALLPSLPAVVRGGRHGPRGTQALAASRDADAQAAAAGPEHEGPLALPGAVLSTEPEVVAAVVAALIHLHFLKVLELEARLGLAFSSRDPGILSFLALPLLLPWLSEVTGSPLGDLSQTAHFEFQAQRRWTEYVDHLQELVPRAIVENLLSTVVPSIVKPA